MQQIVKEADHESIPRKALQHRSDQYQKRLEVLRAEARELLRDYGEQFLDEAFRGGTAGVRAVSVVAKEKEREMKARSRGPAKAGAVGTGSSRPAPYAKPPPPPAKASQPSTRQRSRPPASHTVQAKSEAAIRQVDPTFQAPKTRPGVISQASAMAAAAVLAHIPKAKGVEILEQSCVAQTFSVGGDTNLYWPLIISLMINLLLVIIILRLVLKREKEVKIVYSNTSAQDAEASNEQPTNPSPRVESHRAPPSALAPLSSSSHGLSAEADAFVDPVDDVGDDGEDTTPQDYTRDTNYAGRVAAAAAMTSDDETGDVDLDEAEPYLVEWSMEDYVKGMSSRDVEALALRLGYNKGGPS